MKHWEKLKLTPRLSERRRKLWLEKNQINEELLNEELKYLIECKFLLPIWHSEEEIINWVKIEQTEGRMIIDQPKAPWVRKKPNSNSLKEVVHTKRKLILKEELKDVNGLDHLVLTFSNLDKKVVVFNTSFPDRWHEFKERREYQISYGIFKKEGETIKKDKYILLNFERVKNENKIEEIIKVKEAKLVGKEKLKNINDKDYLILTFENIERKLTLFPVKLDKNGWDRLKRGKKYNLIYGIQKKRDKGILLSFKWIDERKY